MVRLPEGYCIDSTEVTRGQYQLWLDGGPSTTGQIWYCSWNTTFAPDATCLNRGNVCHGESCGNHPMVCVDWCDAFAYCWAVGKRLCGRIGGGKDDPGGFADPSRSQWFNACSSHGRYVYPYGNTYSPDACNTPDHRIMATVPVGSMGTCQSTEPGYQGVFDLVGNVWEWEDSCSWDLEVVACLRRGDSFTWADGDQACTSSAAFEVASTLADGAIGFRCCAD
jgi:formylglycine-generating enzyme required for sulfatase activity